MSVGFTLGFVFSFCCSFVRPLSPTQTLVVYYLVDGMCLDTGYIPHTFLIVNRIEFVIFVFVLFLEAFDTRE